MAALADPDKLVHFDRFAKVAVSRMEAVDRASAEEQKHLLRRSSSAST